MKIPHKTHALWINYKNWLVVIASMIPLSIFFDLILSFVNHTSLPYKSISSIVITLLIAFSGIGIPLTDSLSKLKEKYGHSFTFIFNITRNGQSTTELIKDSFSSIGFLLVLMLTSAFVKNTAFHAIYLATLLFITTYFLVRYCALAIFFIKINDIYYYKALLEKRIIDVIFNHQRYDPSELASQRIQVESLLIKDYWASYENRKNEDIIDFLQQFVERYSEVSRAQEENFNKLLRLSVERYIQLIPVIISVYPINQFNQSLAKIMVFIRSLMFHSNTNVRDTAICLMERFFVKGLEQIINNVNLDYCILKEPLLAVTDDTPTATIIDQYYINASQIYTKCAKIKPSIIPVFINALELRSFGMFSSLSASVACSNLSEQFTLVDDQELRNRLSNIDGDERAVRDFINELDEEIKSSKKTLKIKKLKLKNFLLRYLNYLVMLRLVKKLLISLAFNGEWATLIDILENHSSIYADSTNVGIIFAPYTPESYIFQEKDREFWFESIIDQGQSELYYTHLLSFIIILYSYRSIKKESLLDVQQYRSCQSMRRLRNASERLEEVKNFIVHGYWRSALKKRFLLTDEILKEIEDKTIQHVNHAIKAIGEEQEKLQKNGKLNNDKITQYYSDREKYELKFKKLPLYQEVEGTTDKTKISSPRKLIDEMPREAFLKDTLTHYAFSGGFSVLKCLHDTAVFCYLRREGKSLANFKINDLNPGDIIFLTYSDLELLKNITGKELVDHITTKNGEKCIIYTINSPAMEKYWQYSPKPENAVFRENVSDIVSTTHEVDDKELIIELTTHFQIELIDKEIDKEIKREFKLIHSSVASVT